MYTHGVIYKVKREEGALRQDKNSWNSERRTSPLTSAYNICCRLLEGDWVWDGKPAADEEAGKWAHSYSEPEVWQVLKAEGEEQRDGWDTCKEGRQKNVTLSGGRHKTQKQEVLQTRAAHSRSVPSNGARRQGTIFTHTTPTYCKLNEIIIINIKE